MIGLLGFFRLKNVGGGKLSQEGGFKTTDILPEILPGWPTHIFHYLKSIAITTVSLGFCLCEQHFLKHNIPVRLKLSSHG